MWLKQFEQFLTLPCAQQFEALRRLREVAGQNSSPAEWNSVFGTQSVYEAGTQLPLMQHIYGANRAILRPLLEQRSPWHLVEIGGGNGALWQGFFHAQERGVLTLIDPNPEVHATVAAVLPSGIELHSHIAVSKILNFLKLMASYAVLCGTISLDETVTSEASFKWEAWQARDSLTLCAIGANTAWYPSTQ